MKLNDAIRMADALRTNAVERAQKIVWINELEMKIQSLILHTAPDDMLIYTEEDGETEMLVPRPFDKVYYLWLAAMIDYGNAEYDKYQNDKALADAAYSDYAKWFMRLFHEHGCGKVLYIGGTTKYGLSAYQIACNHGFEGTEEEWVESLNGEDGEDGKDAYTIAKEKGYEGTEEEFYAQLGALSSLENEMTQAVSAAESEADRAETAADRAETATLNAPKVENGTWWVYDAAQTAYVDTGVQAQGPTGEPGNGIQSVKHMGTASSSLAGVTVVEDTYRIFFNNGDTFDFVVKGGQPGVRGEGISNIFFSEDTEEGSLYYAQVGMNTYPILVPKGEKGADGAAGQRGAIYHKVTTAPASYTTAIGDYTPKYRILISTALSQSGQADMIAGDVIRQSYYDYFVDHIEGDYAYISTSRITTRGANGDDGKDGKNGATVVIGTTRSGHTADDCDYLCDGSADDVEIRTAAQALTNGGEIRLLEGTYVLDSDVEIDATVNIAGCGCNTVIACNSLMLYASNSVRDLVFDNCSVRMIGENGSVSHCGFINFEGEAVKADASSCRVTNNHFSEVCIAIYFGSNSSGCLAAHNTIIGSHDNIMDEGTNNAIIGNIIRDGAGSDSKAIGSVGTGTYITDNVVDMAQVAEPMIYNGTNIIHVNNMVNGVLVDAPSGGASSWNDLTDKPFGETYGDTLTWDGDATGREVAETLFVKVSDVAPTVDDLSNGFNVVIDGAVIEIPADEVANFVSVNGDMFVLTDVSAGDDAIPFVLVIQNDVEGCGTKGTYFLDMQVLSPGTFVSSFTINGYTGFLGVKKIEEKFLPDSVTKPSCIKLFGDKDLYLYDQEDTSDTSKRITKAQLLEYVESAKNIYFCVDNYYYCAAGYSFAADFGFVSFSGISGSLHTAEYTGS